MEGRPTPLPDPEAAANQAELRVKLAPTVGGSTCNLYGLEWAISSYTPADSPDYHVSIATHVDEEQASTHYVASVKRDEEGTLEFQPDGSVFMYDEDEWDAFIKGAKDGEFNPKGRRANL
ncbi:MAG TPA: hypothetical protein VLF62_05285 [Candidatus Saccharimonadales bacterium]|nr:hypothetical protein [Candidatus Saccharimonadales bacterium]